VDVDTFVNVRSDVAKPKAHISLLRTSNECRDVPRGCVRSPARGTAWRDLEFQCVPNSNYSRGHGTEGSRFEYWKVRWAP